MLVPGGPQFNIQYIIFHAILRVSLKCIHFPESDLTGLRFKCIGNPGFCKRLKPRT